MNQIAVKQNSQKLLERLAAQRELYSSKNWHGFQIVLTVVIPVFLAGLAFIFNEFAVIAAIFCIASFLINISTVEPVIKKKKAAKIQELFDCNILHLPKSPLKTVDDITVEEVCYIVTYL